MNKYEGFDDLVAFAAVAESGSFKEAGLQLNRDASVISRRLTQIEKRLGVRLLVRTTRNVALTEAGRLYFRRIRSILDELDMANGEVSEFAATPRGVLKISLPVTLGRDVIAPLLPVFLRKHRQIHLEAHFLDRHVDIISEGFDMVIRVGAIRDSSLIARKIGSFRSVLAASPSFVNAHGSPASPDDLPSYECLGFTNHPDWPNWVLEKAGDQKTVRPEGFLIANSNDALLIAAINDGGIALVPEWMLAPHLASGALIGVLAGWRSVRDIPVHAVMPPGALVPAKTRVFVDTLSQMLRDTGIWSEK